MAPLAYARTKLSDGEVSCVLARFGRTARPGGEAKLVEYRLDREKLEKALWYSGGVEGSL